MPLKKVERIWRPELKVVNNFTPKNDENIQNFAEFIYISDEENSDDEHNHDFESNQSIDSKNSIEMIDEISEKHNNISYYIQEFGDYVLPPLIRGLETINEEDEEVINGSSNRCYSSFDDSPGN